MHKFDPNHAEMLLDPERHRWQDPDAILDALGVGIGMVVADIGAGPGFIALPAARKVGPSGKVYALDVEPRMVEKVRARADEEGIGNLETAVSQEAQLPLVDGVVDAALLVNVLHEAQDRRQLLRETARILKQGGALAVVEWKKERQEWGPPFESRLAPWQVREELHRAGFRKVEPIYAGVNHYGLLATK